MYIEGIEITHPDKILFPEGEITKLDMVQYYDKVAAYMLPFLKDRPLTLQRFPDGIGKEGFYQKNASEHFPDFIDTVKIATKEGTNRQVLCNNKKSLLYLANQGTITFHIWLSVKDKIFKPDKVVFDLDPPKGSFRKVKEAAGKIGKFLKKKGLSPNLMTSGKNGFHIWYAISRAHTFDERRKQIKALASEMEIRYPGLLTTAIRKNKREGKIFIDYLRNAYAQTSVCPFSLRPTESAGIATPIEWKELSKIKKADHYHFNNILRRLGQKK